MSPKVRRNDSFRIGYSAGSSDCAISFNMWQKLIAARILKAVFSGASIWGIAISPALLLTASSLELARAKEPDQIIQDPVAIRGIHLGAPPGHFVHFALPLGPGEPLTGDDVRFM